MVVRFPAYREFEASRIATNDAAMALLVSTRLAVRAIEDASPEHASSHLPDVFPSLEHARRLNRTLSDAAQVILDAERQLTYMAIPFSLTVYEAFAKDAIRLMRDARVDTQTSDVTRIKLGALHDYLGDIGIALPRPEVELFDFIRQLRNRIVHHAGIEGSTLEGAFAAMGEAAKGLWRFMAGDDPPLRRPKEPLQLEAKHLIPSLAVTKHLGEAINDGLVRAIPSSAWAGWVTEDFLSKSVPASFDQRLRKLKGFARHRYGDLALDEAVLRRTLTDALVGGG